jgi:hypothetical protein
MGEVRDIPGCGHGDECGDVRREWLGIGVWRDATGLQG